MSPRNYTELDQNQILQRSFDEEKDLVRVSSDFPEEMKDAFSRLRVSSVIGIIDNKNVLTSNQDQFEELTALGGSIVYSQTSSSVDLSVGTTSGAYAIRQSKKRAPYVPGKSHLITMTGVIGPSKPGVVSRIGYFDDNDGLFFQMSETGLALVVRSSVSGSPVDEVFPQSSWNYDKVDGSGASGMVLDPTKCQIFEIDFQWLGVGRVRFSVFNEDEIVVLHEDFHANVEAVPYMKTPTLPVRYEIRNTAESASSSSIKEICSSVMSEGGYGLPGRTFSAQSVAYRNVGTTFTPVFAVRLTSSFNGTENRKLLKFLSSTFLADSGTAVIRIKKVYSPSGIVGSWAAIDSTSAAEYSTDISAYSGTSQVIDTMFSFGGAGLGTGSPTQEATLDYTSENHYLYQNYDSTNSELFVIEARSLTGTVNLLSSLKWVEFK